MNCTSLSISELSSSVGCCVVILSQQDPLPAGEFCEVLGDLLINNRDKCLSLKHNEAKLVFAVSRYNKKIQQKKTKYMMYLVKLTESRSYCFKSCRI